MTGASGFVATHVVQQLLNDGYQVRGTVRSLANSAKVEPLEQLNQKFRNSRNSLELIEADLIRPESIDRLFCLNIFQDWKQHDMIP